MVNEGNARCMTVYEFIARVGARHQVGDSDAADDSLHRAVAHELASVSREEEQELLGDLVQLVLTVNLVLMNRP
jgi:hypothetical protein